MAEYNSFSESWLLQLLLQTPLDGVGSIAAGASAATARAGGE